MLPAAARMRRQAEFTLPSGRAAGPVSPCSPGTCWCDSGDEPARVGFIVSRRVGPAVVRNRVRAGSATWPAGVSAVASWR